MDARMKFRLPVCCSYSVLILGLLLSLAQPVKAISRKGITVTIIGHIPADAHFAITLNKVITAENVIMRVDDAGRFTYHSTLRQPSQFHVMYGKHRDFSFFALNSDTIEVRIPSDSEDVVLMRGISPHANALAQVQIAAFTQHFGRLQAAKNYDSLLNEIEASLLTTPDLGADDYSKILAKSARLYLRYSIGFQKNLPPDRAGLKTIPWQDARYEGIELYTFLMWPAWTNQIEAGVVAQHHDSTYKPTISDLLAWMKAKRATVLPTTYANAVFGVLINGKAVTATDKRVWKAATEGFLRSFPNYPFNDGLRKQYDLLTAEKETALAPPFALTDTSGQTVSLASFKGKYVFLDVWGSWCKPCRKANPGLVAMFDHLRGQNIAFVSIANDDNKSAWLKAIQTDNLQWTQLRATEAFLEAYKISKYPTQLLIAPDGRVLKRDDVSESDILAAIKK